MKKISIAIPNYNRTTMLMEAFEKVYDDERIDEIVVNDDASWEDLYDKVKVLTADKPKVKLYRNSENVDCYKNKALSLSLTNNDFAILLDSDNQIDKSYLDLIYTYDWHPQIIFTPAFASPNFDFREFEGLTISKENVAEYIDRGICQTMLNAANFFVNKIEYLKVWVDSVDPVTSDSIYFCLKWLEAGNKIFVVPSLTYQHRVHASSHYQLNQNRTPDGFHENILQQLRQMNG